MPIDLPYSGSYARTDDTWVAHQTARIRQRYVQFGQHWPLDINRLLTAAAQSLSGHSAIS